MKWYTTLTDGAGVQWRAALVEIITDPEGVLFHLYLSPSGDGAVLTRPVQESARRWAFQLIEEEGDDRSPEDGGAVCIERYEWDGESLVIYAADAYCDGEPAAARGSVARMR